MKTVILDVPVSSIHDELPQQHLDAGEHIVRRIVPLEDLKRTLNGESFLQAFSLPFLILWDLTRASLSSPDGSRIRRFRSRY